MSPVVEAERIVRRARRRDRINDAIYTAIVIGALAGYLAMAAIIIHAAIGALS